MSNNTKHLKVTPFLARHLFAWADGVFVDPDMRDSTVAKIINFITADPENLELIERHSWSEILDIAERG